MAKLTKVRCKNCNRTFYRPTGRFNEAIKSGWNQYCSRKCELKHKTKRQFFKCENCGKNFERTLKSISPHNYCSQSCAAIINNKNRERDAETIKCKNCEKIFKRWIVGNKKYCSRACRTEAERYRPEELIDIIQKSFKKLKRVPARREILNGVNEACRKSFGSWNKAVLAAGFTPNRSHDDRMYKRIISKAKDGHLCDSVSEVLIDDWLYKNNILHEKDAHYPDTNHKADWTIISNGNKIFIEYFGLANDSPRYDRCIKEKEVLCEKQNIPLIAIYPKDLYPKIYSDINLKNKFKDYLTI